MIMDMCFSISNITEKRRIHFQEFMIDIHNRLHEIRKYKYKRSSSCSGK